MKVSIIGGGGLVGSSAGFALQAGGIVRDICLVDVNPELAEGISPFASERLYVGAEILSEKPGAKSIGGGKISRCACAWDGGRRFVPVRPKPVPPRR